MGIFQNLFGKKKVEKKPVTSVKNPDLIELHDEFGKAFYIPRNTWKEKVLGYNLEKAKNNPDELYSMLVTAVQDGFAGEVVSHAEQLYAIDPLPDRGTTMLGIVYMKAGRLDDAERVFQTYISRHGEDGIILTNLAKVYSEQGKDSLAEATLWHALELNPNQENGFMWFVAMHHERGGDAAAQECYRKIAKLPGSWRVLLWQAQSFLRNRDRTAAEKLYLEAIRRAGQPIPSDLLMQMSGDLGQNGYLNELIRLVAPHYDSKVHGLQVGNNLIKAYLDLGQPGQAHSILDELYTHNRPDWRPTLDYWEKELAKAHVAEKAADRVPGSQSMGILTIEGPLWGRDNSPFAAFFPEKTGKSKRVAIIGSTALLREQPKKLELQLSNAPGRLSRSVPLLLSEHIHLTTEASGTALIAFMGEQAFALFGTPFEDNDVVQLMGRLNPVPDMAIAVTVDTRESKWRIALRLIKVADGTCLGTSGVKVNPDNPGPAVRDLLENTHRLLEEKAGIPRITPPSWYKLPIGKPASEYLLRLEQQLAVIGPKGQGLYGEHEILDGILQLCISQPGNKTIKMMLVQTFRQMKKIRPGIISEYRQKLDRLLTMNTKPDVIEEQFVKSIRELF
ncbi:MAG: tetratricopeptide repeat protein [Acidobacteria bacterium]|nr:tetratricopeptide repeat protein [Acidobacteriota bacterium]